MAYFLNDNQENVMFHKAERKQAKLRLALCGTSGSGKTFSALKIAAGLGGKIAMIDTEHKSGELYANEFKYEVATLDPPFSPNRYIEIIKMAESSGFNVLIIDSLSHAWTGQGGVLEMHDQACKTTHNSFAAWRDVTPHHNALVDAMLQSSLHIITTMRTKTAYEVQQNDKGKHVPVKVGLAPIQRDGMEYEFTAVLDLSIDGHIATSSKDRTSLFDGTFFKPSEKTGEQLLKWLNTGVDEEKQSREELEKLEQSMLFIKSLPQLENWGLRNKDIIETMLNHDKRMIRSAYVGKRNELQAELENELSEAA